jgi:hypothetical protein
MTAVKSAHLTSPIAIKALNSRLTPPESPLSTRTVRTAAGRNANRKLSFSHLTFPNVKSSPSPQKKGARAKTLVSRASKHFFVKMPTLISVNPPVPPPSMALPPTPSSTSLVPSTSTSTAAPAPLIYLNASGHRLDYPASCAAMRYDPLLRDDFRNREKSPCYEYHLLRNNVTGNVSMSSSSSPCPRAGKCPHTHGPPMTSRSALETLAYLARCTPCEKQGKCRDARCVRGHVCPIEDDLCCPEVCDFGVEGHGVDPVVVKKVVGDV